jgi:hypothetical protein
MVFVMSRGPRHVLIRLALPLLTIAMLQGCSQQKSVDQALDQQIKENPKLERVKVAKFAGRVTVDGQPPQAGYKLFVILNDPNHLDAAARSGGLPKLYTGCDVHGRFSFSTNGVDDGAPVGNYVVTFVELRQPGGGKFRPRMGVGSQTHFTGPDELKNLYNDPDKNAKDDKFKVDVQPPGKTDYNFDLSIAGKEPAQASPNAVTTIGER